jgi:L-aspartate oxidase
MMGGVRTDLDGRTTLRGLYAAGEVSCTGVHGANRLASNSLLEGLVFGARASKAMLEDGLSIQAAPDSAARREGMRPEDDAQLEIFIRQLQRSMWAYAGLLRDDAGILNGYAAPAECDSTVEHFLRDGRHSRRLFEAGALSRVARAILDSAHARLESRGAHFRTDYPHHDDANFRKHSIYGRGGGVLFESW